MDSWPTNEEREIALVMGNHFRRSIGWKTEFFLPQDRFCVIAYGPRFQSMDGYDLFEDSVERIETDLRMGLSSDFWARTTEWSFYEVVREVLMKKESTLT